MDISATKVEIVNQGECPIVESGMSELIKEMANSQRLRATTNTQEAIDNSDVSLVCVGTPSNPNGSLDLSYVERVCQEIGSALRSKADRHTVVIRSTMLPGSTQKLADENLRDLASSGQAQVFYFPEFLRESTAVADFRDPSLVVVRTLANVHGGLRVTESRHRHRRDDRCDRYRSDVPYAAAG